MKLITSQNIYSNTLAEYQSSKLLSSQKLRRIADTKYSDIYKLLLDFGYNGDYLNINSYDVDLFLSKQIKQLAKFIKETATLNALAKILLNPFYYSDAKAIYKKQFSDTEVTLYLDLDNPLGVDTNAIIEDLGENPTAKEIDLAFTKAMHNENLLLAKQISPTFIEYTKTQIDIDNILSLYRSSRMGYNKENAREELIEGGNISLEEFTSLDNLLDNPIFEESLTALITNDITNFRSLTNEILLDILKKNTTNFLSFGPFIKYILAQIAEYDSVRQILIAKKNNLSLNINSFGGYDDL
ncbi:MAG: V-type ATPase subunit [Firmicutes bacterium]|nr:V-type ATPase subunit [Bacillota bacterium]